MRGQKDFAKNKGVVKMDSVSGVSFGNLTGINTENYKHQDMQDLTGTAGLHDASKIDLQRNSSVQGNSLDFGA